MLESFLSVYRDFAPLALRLALGVILVRHGWPKLKLESLKNPSGWLGQIGFPLPMYWAVSVAILESFGGLALIFGLLTSWVALFVAIQFLVIIFIVNKSKSFAEKELDILIFAIALTLIFLGGGFYSLDSWFNFAF